MLAFLGSQGRSSGGNQPLCGNGAAQPGLPADARSLLPEVREPTKGTGGNRESGATGSRSARDSLQLRGELLHRGPI